MTECEHAITTGNSFIWKKAFDLNNGCPLCKAEQKGKAEALDEVMNELYQCGGSIQPEWFEEKLKALKSGTSHQCWDGCPCQKDDIGLIELKKKKWKELNDKHL